MGENVGLGRMMGWGGSQIGEDVVLERISGKGGCQMSDLGGCWVEEDVGWEGRLVGIKD